MRRLFKIGHDRHSAGKVVYSWHPEGNFLASAGGEKFTYSHFLVVFIDDVVYSMSVE